MPRPSLEVVEAQFPLEILVHPFCAPALFDDAYVLLVAHAARQCRKIELGCLLVVQWPLDNEPLFLSLIDRCAIIVGRLDATEREASPKLPGCLRASEVCDACGAG